MSKHDDRTVMGRRATRAYKRTERSVVPCPAYAADERWKAEASLNAAKRHAMAALNGWTAHYRELGYSGGAERAKAVTHLPDSLLAIIGVDRYNV